MSIINNYISLIREVFDFNIIMRCFLIVAVFLFLYIFLIYFVVRKIRTAKMKVLAKELGLSFKEKIIYQFKSKNFEDVLIKLLASRNIIEGEIKGKNVLIADIWELERGNPGGAVIFVSKVSKKFNRKFKLSGWRPTIINGSIYWDIDPNEIKNLLEGKNENECVRLNPTQLSRDIGAMGLILYYQFISKGIECDLNVILNILYGYYKIHNNISDLFRDIEMVDIDKDIDKVNKFLKAENIFIEDEKIKSILLNFRDYFKNTK